LVKLSFLKERFRQITNTSTTDQQQINLTLDRKRQISHQKEYKHFSIITFMDETKIKEAFSKVREDMNIIKTAIESIKVELSSRESTNKALEAEVQHLKTMIQWSNQQKNNDFFLFSSGNKGVFRQTDNRQTTDTRQIFDTEAHIESIFLSLTEKEFLLFLTLYQLEEELKIPISYTQLASKLSLSQSSIRDHISEIIRKKAPITKVKVNNKKVLLSIDKPFKNLNIMGKILNIRHFQESQTTLYDL